MVEDLAPALPKLLELGIVGFIACYLITRGISTMQNLTSSIKDLSGVISNLQNQVATIQKSYDSINLLQVQVDNLNNRFNNLEAHLDNRLAGIEKILREAYRSA